MPLLLLFSFLSGLTTILAPCIWPVLPIILSFSIAGNKSHKRPLGIALGVVLSFAFFILSISYIVHILHIEANILRIIASLIIVFLGLTMVVPTLSTKFEVFVTKLSNLFSFRQNSNADFWSGFITGISLGIVWTPCAGPILATIATLAATGQVSTQVVLVTLVYVTGVGVPLFLFAYGGQKLITNLKFFNKYTLKIQKVFGVLMILSGIAIYTNYSQTLQLAVLNNFPTLGSFVNGFENSSVVTNQLNQLSGKSNVITPDTKELFNINTPAPEFSTSDRWLNTNTPLSIKTLKGKVVLVDFWTYTCINCIRTLPFVTSWYEKYKDKGFIVIGVHTPEFEFEHDTQNVQEAIKKYKINYPVLQDNEYKTWDNYANQYWPAEYLIDVNGNIRRAHFGEGEYDKTEKAIQTLLEEAGHKIDTSTINMTDQTPTQVLTPETYLGNARRGLTTDLSLQGDWKNESEYIESGQNSSLSYKITASRVYIILQPSSSQTNKVRVLLDGNLINQDISGSDVHNGEVTIDSDRLYNIIDLKDKTETHELKLEFENPGIKVYTFTFG